MPRVSFASFLRLFVEVLFLFLLSLLLSSQTWDSERARLSNDPWSVLRVTLGVLFFLSPVPRLAGRPVFRRGATLIWSWRVCFASSVSVVGPAP